MREQLLSDLGSILSGVVGKSADYADIYMQSGASHGLLFEEGRMDTLSSSRSDGLGVRVVKGDDTVYAHTPGTTVHALAHGLREASSLSDVALACPADPSDEAILDERPALPALDPGFFHDLDKMLRAECKYLRQATFRYRTSIKSILIVRGDGTVARDRRKYTTFAANVVLDRDGDLQTGYEVRSLQAGADDFWTHGGVCTAEDIAREALARGILMLDAVPCPAGTMTVLMEGTAGGTMIHEACGHGLEADIIQKDYSVFRDRLGEVVANPLVTIVDDATLPGRYGSYACDDEGTPARRTVLVENGVLKNYLTDIVSAQLGGLPRTGNGRRESYQHVPLPRMSNTFITPGTSTRDEMLSGVKEGLLVRKMGGGEVNPTSGDFVFFVSEGYLIRDGKVGAAVKGATLTGNGPESLRNILAVGSELVLDPGTCGKSGQGVPVTDGQPTLLIENLIVGGSDTGDGD
ncbi:TldD/PmbA family protein [Synergistaceae bacterium OttesenSCG-928-I11]|nr:TldD/PmbA family protein [Synergistaceae bacterium OttesenSCG-928-I11]